MSNKSSTAVAVAEALRRNASAFHERRATYEAFDLRARALWDAARAAGVADAVSALVCPLPGGAPQGPGAQASGSGADRPQR